jgi:hypothetical protein
MNLTSVRLNSRFFALGNSADDSFSDADILRHTNLNYHELVSMAVRFDGDWSLLDNTKLQRSITAGTRKYALPTMPVKITRVEVKYPSTAGDYTAATQISDNSVPPDGFDGYCPASPEYRLNGTYIEVFLPNRTSEITAVTNGINVYYEAPVTELSAVGDATVLPEFANKLLCLMNARDYCGVNGLNSRLSWLERQIGNPETEGIRASGAIANFLDNLKTRSRDKRASIKFRREDYGQSGSMNGSPRSVDFG